MSSARAKAKSAGPALARGKDAVKGVVDTSLAHSADGILRAASNSQPTFELTGRASLDLRGQCIWALSLIGAAAVAGASATIYWSGAGLPITNASLSIVVSVADERAGEVVQKAAFVAAAVGVASYLLVILGLGNRSTWARRVATLFAVIGGLGVFTVSYAAASALGLVGVALLWLPASSAWFRAQPIPVVPAPWTRPLRDC